MTIQKNENKLQVKDYINIGIFSAILMVLYLIAGITNLTPATYLLYSPMTALLGAIPFMFINLKVPKRGAILVFAIVPFLYFMLLSGTEGMIVALFFVIFAIIAEMIMGKDRKNLKKLIVSYIFFSSWNAVGGQFRLFVFTDAYLDFGRKSGLSDLYIEYLRVHATLRNWIIIIVVSIIASIIGMFVSKLIFKKHIIKAGIL